VKCLIVFTQISFIAIWVVLRAIDIYTEKADGSIKSVIMAVAGHTRANPEATSNGSSWYIGKKSGYARSMKRI